MKQSVAIACILLLVSLNASSTEGSIRRRVARAEANAQIRTLRLNYPGPWGLRLRNYADTRILSEDGLLDQVLKRLLDQIADSGSSADFMTAKTTPTPNRELQATLESTLAIGRTLKIEDQMKAPQVPVPQSTGGKNANFDVEIP
jgi:hypothetical protein